VQLLILLGSVFSVQGQLDPERRRLPQLGYNQALEGRSPIAAYGFFYYNQPGFYETNLTLRAAIAPVYLDAELGFAHLLSPRTDFAVGVSGGGFARSYDEIRLGELKREESFVGHGGGLNSSIYHLFNPGDMIPLYGVLRGAVGRDFYERDSKTDDNFVVPANVTSANVLAGFRYGGKEPTLTASLAMELSVWYEGEFRFQSQTYGYSDRDIEPNTHSFWTRALLAYVFDTLRHRWEVSLTAGTTIHPDRFSAYRLGGVLPFASEFPLNLPGYYYRELSAQQFALLNAQYSVPIDSRERFQITGFAATGPVDYLSGFEQPGHWHSGVGGGITYRSTSGPWLVTLMYGHAFDAIRSDGRGANQVGILLQYDFEASSKWFDPGVSPYRSRGLERLFRN
jgi:hypothetical protein